MKVFISWSGEHSKAVAQALSKLIKVVIQSAKPWVSTREIQAGDRWSNIIADGLIDAQFGIICVTPTNQTAPWLNFEAGAIAKNVEESKIVPYLHGLTAPNMINGPLSQFQAKESNKEGTLEVLSAINNVLPSPLDIETLKEAFDSYWLTFENTLDNIDLTPEDVELSVRSQDDKIDELLEITKSRNESDRDGLESIANRLKYMTIILDSQGLFKDPQRIWPSIVNLFNIQLRAFTKPAIITVDEENRILTLKYPGPSVFHYKQAKRFEHRIQDALNIVTAGRYRLNIFGPEVKEESNDTDLPW